MKKPTRALAAPLIAAAVLAGSGAALASTGSTAAHQGATSVKPTVVLVHGAFADSSSWTSEIKLLQGKGYPVVAVANPLRGVASDSAYLLSVLKTISGPIVLVGQGSNLVERTEPGGTDIYVNPADFGQVYAGGLSKSQIAVAAVTQRPITAAALAEATTVNPPAAVPKWEIVAQEDHAIPTQAELFMANRAHAHIVETHSGHDVPAAQPGVVDSTIVKAAQSVSGS